MNCIGIDVGKQELAAFDGQDHHVFPNTLELKELREFLKNWGNDLLLVFEPTSTYSSYLELLCLEEGIPCSMPNPRIVPHLREVEQERSKTDLTDSQLLYLYGIEKNRRKIIIKDSVASGLSSFLALHKTTQKHRVALQGLREALSRDPMADDSVLTDIEEEIDSLKAKEKEIIRRACAFVRNSWDKGAALDRLMTIPCVAEKTGLALLCFFRQHGDTNQKQTVSLAGLDPVTKQSGTSIKGKSRISKRGDDDIRRILYESTLSATTCNPAIRVFYQRMKKKEGITEKAARIAAARKILVMAHSIYKNKDIYRCPKAVRA